VRIDVRPSAVGGPDFYHEIPIMVGAINQVAGQEEDFRERRSGRSSVGAGDDKPAANQANDNGDQDDKTPGATLQGNDDEDDGDE
jgi:hypothetical protein